MRRVTLSELVENFITHIDENILTLSENQIDTFIADIYDEPDVLKELLTKVEKKREYYFHHQNRYNYTALKTAATYLMLIIIFLCLSYFISSYYSMPLKKELAILIKNLEPFDITVIRDKTEGIAFVTKTSKQFTQQEALVIKNLISQIYQTHLKLDSSSVAWAKAIITLMIAILTKPSFDCICEFLWPKYKKRYEKYCLIEQKLHEALNRLS